MANWRDRLREIETRGLSLPHDKIAKTDKIRRSDSECCENITHRTPEVGVLSVLAILSDDHETETGKRIRAVRQAAVDNWLPDEPEQLREWRTGIARIDRDRPPKGFPERDWHALHHDAGPFLDTWGVQAVALGWSTLDLFGVHRLAPAANYSAIGLVPLLRGSVVVAMTADSATIQRGTGARLTFPRHPPHPDAIPVWELPR